jgi:hypothetical protein
MLAADGFDVTEMTRNILFASDHMQFSNGVMLAFARRSRLGPLYLPNIHTAKDTVCNVENIVLLGETIGRFLAVSSQPVNA